MGLKRKSTGEKYKISSPSLIDQGQRMESKLVSPSSSNSKGNPNLIPLAEARIKRSWADIPIDLIPTIAAKASTTKKQYVRLRAVCTTWRKLLPPNAPHLPPHVVWLMLPRFPQDLCQKLGISDSDLSFYDISQWKTHRLHLPYMSGKYCCGTSYGWLVLDHDHKMSLFNPITGKSIKLPSLDAPPTLLVPVAKSEAGSSNSVPSNPPDEYTICVHKASLSGSPSNPAGCGIVVWFTSSSDWELGFCRIGDNHWKGLRKRDPSSRLLDFTFHKNLVYTADIKNEICVYDLQNLSMRKFLPGFNSHDFSDYQINLVEGDENSGGPLVIMTFERHGKNFFLFYKCDERDKLCRVREIGNRMLFLNARLSVNLQCGKKQGLVYYDVRQSVETDTFRFAIRLVDLKSTRRGKHVPFHRGPTESFSFNITWIAHVVHTQRDIAVSW